VTADLPERPARLRKHAAAARREGVLIAAESQGGVGLGAGQVGGGQPGVGHGGPPDDRTFAVDHADVHARGLAPALFIHAHHRGFFLRGGLGLAQNNDNVAVGQFVRVVRAVDAQGFQIKTQVEPAVESAAPQPGSEGRQEAESREFPWKPRNFFMAPPAPSSDLDARRILHPPQGILALFQRKIDETGSRQPDDFSGRRRGGSRPQGPRRPRGRGFKFTEGPARGPEGAVYFTDIPTARVLRHDPVSGRTEVFRNESGGANGLMFDRQGRLVMYEGKARRVTRLHEGRLQVLAEKFEGRRLDSPNDLAIDAQGGHLLHRSALRRPPEHGG
jgi:hypothetical protein